MPPSAVLYHLTPTANLAAIVREGLLPRIGARAAQLEEPQPAIYLFGSREDLDNALSNWLGEEFDAAGPLTLLEVHLPAGVATRRVAFEVQVLVPIPPGALRVISEDYGA